MKTQTESQKRLAERKKRIRGTVAASPAKLRQQARTNKKKALARIELRRVGRKRDSARSNPFDDFC